MDMEKKVDDAGTQSDHVNSGRTVDVYALEAFSDAFAAAEQINRMLSENLDELQRRHEALEARFSGYVEAVRDIGLHVNIATSKKGR